MSDPSIVPWSLVWCGLILAICGLALALHTIDHPKQSPLASVGAVGVVLGIVLMVVPLLVNGTVMLERALCAAAQKAFAPARP